MIVMRKMSVREGTGWHPRICPGRGTHVWGQIVGFSTCNAGRHVGPRELGAGLCSTLVPSFPQPSLPRELHAYLSPLSLSLSLSNLHFALAWIRSKTTRSLTRLLIRYYIKYCLTLFSHLINHLFNF